MDAGSIPASAGKPRAAWWHPSMRRVYPRECGETELIVGTTVTRKGLSPRVRGNPRRRPRRQGGAGSIPASAGKPISFVNAMISNGVYPRECGETALVVCGGGFAWGLSPRVRGNLDQFDLARVVHGSIPASAGKPCASARLGCRRRVYPRECGETRNLGVDSEFLEGLSPRVRGNPRTSSRM